MQHILNEILISIFEWLSNKHLIHEVGLVNKLWRNTMLHPCIWRTRTIDIDRFLDPLPLSLIQFIEECDITKFTLNSHRHLKQIALQFHETVTKLKLSSYMTVHRVTPDELFDVPSFPAMQDFYGYSSRLIRQMPNLTSVLTLIYGPKKDESLKTIYSLKNLKKLDQVGDYITQQDVMDLFQKLPLLEDVRVLVDKSVTPSVWHSVFQIEGVSNRLKRLSIEDDVDSNPGHTSSNIVINNLKRLHIYGILNSHKSILYASQHTLTDLSLRTTEDEDFSGLKIPNLKYLRIYGQLPKNFIPLLLLCQNKLKDLFLELEDEQEYKMEECLNFPQLTTLTLNEQTSNFYTTLFENMDGKRLMELTISECIVPTIENIFPVVASRLTNLRYFYNSFKLFKLIPKSILHNISLVFITEPVHLNEDALKILLNCSNLTTLAITTDDNNEISADNWLVRLLNNCKKLKRLTFTAVSSSKVDFTEMEHHPCLSHLVVHDSSVQQQRDLLLKNTPKLRNFKL
jgi:hypothetical protein